MFYSQFILAKKGPLGTIWIAAHLERKLRKNQVADTDIGVSVDSILFPEVPIALRLSSHLLLGVVRIYSRKVNYLFDDCSETLLKVKQAFRSAAVDLPPEESTAPYHSITLPETFDLDDFELPDHDIFQGNYVDRHVSTKEQITLQDTMEGMVYTNSQFGLDERFGDGDASQIGLDLDEVMLIDKDVTLEHDDLSANPQVSHQEDEKKEEVMLIDEEATLEHDGFSANPQVSHQEVEKKKEVMLIDEDAILEHDGFSANPQVSHQEGEKKGEVCATSDRMQVEDSGIKIDLIAGLPTVDEVNEYAQGPSTPGLEEPNLFVTQLDQVNNEPDYHNSADLVAMETTQKEMSAHQAENDVIDCSVQDNRKHVVVDMHHETSDHLLVEVDSKRQEQDLVGTVVMKDQENLIHTDHCMKSVTLMDSSDKDQPTNLIPECAGGMFDASDIPQMVEDLHDRVLMNNEPVVTPLNHPLNAVAGGGSVNEAVASPARLHVTSDQDDHSCKLLSNMDGSRGPEFDGHMEDSNTLSNRDTLNNNEISKSGEQPHAFYEAPISNIISPQGSPGRPEIVDVEAQASLELKEAAALKHVSHETEQPTESHLRPCTSHLSQPSLSSIEGKNCHETDVSDPTLGHCDTVEPSAREGKLDLGKSAMQFRNQTLSNEMERIKKSAASDLPQPEKMLSLAYQHNCEANDFLVGSTPDNQGISEGQTADVGTKYISGKKRSYTESILTAQNVDSIDSYGGAQSKQTDSYGGAQSKRTAESIPHDDDLLSSILAGRSSSLLKIKPSPAVPDTVSTKRRRSAPRTSSALKRKVFMDDMMVLHGDTIRQQLTNTADIRRMRKKAPCTRPEILMIQRQFLEDEIFRKPIFTDLTANLTILRSETFDLSGIKVCDYGLDESLIEKTNDQESYSRTNIEIHGGEVNNEPMAVQPPEDTEAQPTDIPDLSYSRENIEIHGVEANDEPTAVQPQEDTEAQPTEMPDLSYSRTNIESHGVEANNEPMAVQLQGGAVAQTTEIPDLSYSRTNIEMHGVEANNEPVAVQPQENAEAQPTEMPNLSQSHQSEANLGSHNLDAHGDTSLISQGKELDISQTVEMNNPVRNIQISDAENFSVGPRHESSSLPEVFENHFCMPNDFDASSPLMDKMNDLVGSIHTNVLSIPTSKNLNTFPILEHELLEGRDRIEVDTIDIPEHTMEISTEVQTDGLEPNDLCASLVTASKEANECIDNQAFFAGGLPIEENGNSVLGGLNEDQIVSFGLGCDDKDAESGSLLGENTKVECLHSLAPVDEKESSLNDEENRVCQEAAFEGSMCADGSAIMSPFVEQNNENDTVAIDTEFLNVGDDEIIDDEDDGDFTPSATGSHFENSGWSSRTRNVAKYLQILFHKEDLHGRQDLHLENILAGKTRKEASRMFFETLVLKTKDYVHVEQTKPFANINIKPRMKLMKSDF